jgi:serine/threonine protein kinase
LLSIEPGQVFAGDFRIVRKIAEGGMGAVYVVDQLSTGQQRALKLMHGKLVPDARSRERFLQEAKISSRIESEHVVSVLGAGVDATTGLPWLAMELLDGSDLDQMVRERGPLPVHEVLELMEQLCHALGDAHDKGIIHRDLKPENVFLARSRRRGTSRVLKILDFGIAAITEAHRSGALVTSAIGSPAWMAPEQATAGATLRPSTDVWSMALITFYLLTGKSYWLAMHQPAFSLPQLLHEILQVPITLASERARSLGAPALPDGFDAWWQVAMSRDPGERYANARSAYDALKRELGSRVPKTNPFGPEQIAAWTKHAAVPPTMPPPARPANGVLLAWIGIGIAVLIVLAGGLALYALRD